MHVNTSKCPLLRAENRLQKRASMGRIAVAIRPMRGFVYGTNGEIVTGTLRIGVEAAAGGGEMR